MKYHILVKVTKHINPNPIRVVVGKVRKNYLPNEGGKGVEKKCTYNMPAGAEARTQDLSHARRKSVAARYGGGFDKLSFFHGYR